MRDVWYVKLDQSKGVIVEPYSVADTDALFQLSTIWLICLVLMICAHVDLGSSLFTAKRPAVVAFKRHLIVVAGMLGIWVTIYFMHLSLTDIREAAGAYWNADIHGKFISIVAWGALFSPLLALITVYQIDRARRAEMRDRARAHADAS